MKEIKLTKGLVTLVDDEDYEELTKYKWYAQSGGKYYYAMRRKMDKLLSIHRILMNAPVGMDVDHKNHDTLDNRKTNLRVCTRSQNIGNSNKNQTDCSSKYKGVSWSKRKNKWIVSIKLNYKTIFLGYFYNEIFAASVYDIKANELFGEFAQLNFPDGGVHYATPCSIQSTIT